MESLSDIASADVDLSVPVLRKDVPACELLSMLRREADKRFAGNGEALSPSKQSQYRQHLRAIGLFGDFLAGRGAINVDERLLDGFVAHLSSNGGDGRPFYWLEFAGDIRGLVNALPDGVRRRALLTPTRAKAAGRLARLSPESREAILKFLRDGRKVRQGSSLPLSAMEPLMDSTKENAVGTVLTILDALGLSDLRGLTTERLEQFLKKYAAKGKEDTARGYFADIGALFRNLAATGFVAEVPPQLRARKPKRVNRDYVGPEGIARLQDLGTVDMDDFLDVRDRMIVLTLLYDFCLREGEAVRLDEADVRVEDFVVIGLRGGIQKGSHKEDKTLYSCVRESVDLVRRYLWMRGERRPRTGALLVAADGDRLLEQGCIDATKGQCRKLGITTFRGKTPSCHRLRHAFGTLNIEPLGVGLSLYEVMERLRHEDVQTTRKVYIDNNPVLEKARHEARMRRNGSHPAGADGKGAEPAAGDIRLPERQALALFDEHDMGIKAAALRRAAVAGGWGRQSGRAFLYSASAVGDLAANWITKQEAAAKLGLTMPRYFHWTSRRGIETRVIGKASLVRRSDVRAAQREMRKGAA